MFSVHWVELDVFYFSKLLQATGLTVILIDFIRQFPNLMSRKTLGIGVALFVAGWLLERFRFQK